MRSSLLDRASLLEKLAWLWFFLILHQPTKNYFNQLWLSGQFLPIYPIYYFGTNARLQQLLSCADGFYSCQNAKLPYIFLVFKRSG
jgi:hypothetical protein